MKCIAVSTVETHVSNICRKLGATNRFDCAIKAIKSGAIRLRESYTSAEERARWDGAIPSRRSLIA